MPTCPNCNHEFQDSASATPEQPYNRFEGGQLFDTFRGLADSVLAHVRSTGVEVICFDDPYTRRIGFDTRDMEGPHGRRWQIPLSNLRQCQILNPYRSYLMTTEGRSRLAAIWSQGHEPTEDFVSDPVTAPVA